jgi:hypothetical protein
LSTSSAVIFIGDGRRGDEACAWYGGEAGTPREEGRKERTKPRPPAQAVPVRAASPNAMRCDLGDDVGRRRSFCCLRLSSSFPGFSVFFVLSFLDYTPLYE